MKRFIIIASILVLVIAGTVIGLPFAFKGKISKLVLQKANESVEASITYGSYRLTLLSSFPDLTATFSDVDVVGKGVFSSDTLAHLGKLSMEIDLSSLFKGDAILLKSVGLDNSSILLVVSESGLVNWEIEKATSASVAPVNSENKVKGEPLKMLLPQIEVRNLDFIYTDREGNYEFSTLKVNGHMSGEMVGMNTVLDVVAETPSLNFRYENVDYMKDGKISLQTKLLADFDKFEFRFQAGDSKVNNLPLQLEGTFAYPNDSMFFDFKFEMPDISMKQILALVPADYQKYMKDVDATGKINFDGIAKGVYYEEIYPQIDVNFNISNGVVKYPGLPDQLNIDQLSATISKPEGSLDLLAVGVKNMQMRMAQNPFSMHAYFNNLFTDPHLDVALNGKIDLETLSKIIPFGDNQLKGLMDANATVVGNYSSVEKNDFTAFKSAGTVGLKNFYLKNSSFPDGVSIQNAELVLKNQDLQVNGLQGKIGKSDFALKGQLNNLLAYVFEDKTLKGKFELNSNYIDINELLASNTTSATTKTADKVKTDSIKVASDPIEFPKNIELVFNARIAKLRYDQLDISNFNGALELKNQKLNLSGLSMNMLDGQMKMSGSVLADGRPEPDVDLDLNILGFDLPSAFKNISMVQKYMPFAEKSQGEFNTTLKLRSNLTTDLSLILSKITASGMFISKNIKLLDSSLFDKLKSVIQSSKLKNYQIDDFAAGFSISNGNLNIKPFKTAIGKQPVTIGGVYNLGGTLDFRVDATLEKDILSADIQKIIAYVPGSDNIKKIDIGVDIKGDAKKPDVKFDKEKIKTQVVNQVKKSSKKEIEDAAKKLLNKVLNSN